ncbi:MAG TPA: SRPBCC family protein [Nocardioidaceae bacterium]
MRNETTVTVSAPCEKVWDVMTDVECWPEITESVTSVEKLDPGPLHVGSRVRIRQPRLPAAEWVVTEVVERSRFTWESTAPGVRSTAVHEVASAGAGTSQLHLSIDQEGRLGGLVSRLYRGMTDRYINLEANGIKRRSEGTA